MPKSGVFVVASRQFSSCDAVDGLGLLKLQRAAK